MSEVYKNRKKRLIKALNALTKNLYKSAAICAREFDIDHRLFNEECNWKKSKLTRAALNKRLSANQKFALKEYIEYVNILSRLANTDMNIVIDETVEINYDLKRLMCNERTKSTKNLNYRFR